MYFSQDGFNQKKDEKENELLQKKIKELTTEDIEKLFEQGLSSHVDIFMLDFFKKYLFEYITISIRSYFLVLEILKCAERATPYLFNGLGKIIIKV